MITKIAGRLESLDDHSAVVAPPEGEGAWSGVRVWYEVMIPSYLAGALRPRVGARVELVTLEYLEAQGQGSSFVPRLIGFASVKDRAFFELFTTVKGIGNRRALRALAVEPARIARAIVERNARALTELPEVGKRLAETIIAELTGKVEGYLSAGEAAALEGAAEVKGLTPAGSEAVEALVALGEARVEAERKVARALSRAGGKGVRSADEVLSLVYAGG